MARKKDLSKIHRLYDAALQLVQEHGFHSLTMAQVAKQAGIATGSIYTYFQGKEEMINALYLHLKLEKMQAMLSVYQPEESFLVNFRQLWLKYFLLSYQEPDKMHFIEQYTYSPLLSPQTRQEADRLLTPLINLLESAKQEQLLKDIPATIMIQHVIGGTLEVVKYFLNHEITPQKNDIESCFEITWSSIKK